MGWKFSWAWARVKAALAAATEALNVNGQKIVNVGAAVDPTDAITKAGAQALVNARSVVTAVAFKLTIQSGTNMHAAVRADAANAFPGPITAPDYPRGVEVLFAAGWDGGNVIVHGTDATGAVYQETLVSLPGGTRKSVRAFKTVSSIEKTVVGVTANTATVKFNDRVGLDGYTSFSVGVMDAGACVGWAAPYDKGVLSYQFDGTGDPSGSGINACDPPNGVIDFGLAGGNANAGGAYLVFVSLP